MQPRNGGLQAGLEDVERPSRALELPFEGAGEVGVGDDAGQTLQCRFDHAVIATGVSVVGGRTPANHDWRQAIQDLARGVQEARAGVESPLNVNIVFQVPGNVVQPDHSGLRTGRYSKADCLLMVQVALPEAAPDDATAYLRAAAMRALDEAEAWAAERHRGASLDALRDVLARA